MRLKFSSNIPARYRDELEILAHIAFRGVSHIRVELHVKAKGDKFKPRFLQLAQRIGSPDEVAFITGLNQRHLEQFTGRAYLSIPGIANVATTTRQLITLTIPRDLDALSYPRDWHYPGLKSCPTITLRSWQEQFIHLVAHEASHIAQHRHRRGHQSEVRAEQHARAILNDWRDPILT